MLVWLAWYAGSGDDALARVHECWSSPTGSRRGGQKRDVNERQRASSVRGPITTTRCRLLAKRS